MKNPEHKLLPLGAMLCSMTFAVSVLADTTDTKLETVHVTGTEESTPAQMSYQGGKTKVGKVAQLPKDIPQSVTVVTNKLMEDRNANTFKEALRNVAGLTFNAGEGGRIGDNITIRGYSAVGDLYLDGMRDIAQYNRETFNLEQIDVLRGSSSMLFGRGSTGGVINQVSKQAQLTDRNRISTTQGSYDYQRYTADLNKQLGDSAALRFNAMSTDNESFRDEVENHRSGYAPTISFGLNTDNTLSLSHYHLEEDNIPDYGVPYLDPDGAAGPLKAKPLDVDRKTFYGMSDVDYEQNDTDITTAAFTHKFNANSELTTRLRWADYERDLWAVAPRAFLPVAGTPMNPVDVNDVTRINRGHQGRGGEENTITSQTDFTTHFATGFLQHELLLGNEILQEKSNRWNNPLASGATNPAADVFNPDATPTLAANYNSWQKVFAASYEGESRALYFQDVVGLTEQWKVLLGARRDYSNNEYERVTGGDLERKDIVNSWRTGLMYQPDDATTYYVSKGSSFNPSAELYQLDDRNTNTDPEKSQNTEVGAKWELMEGDLSLRTSLSRSEKTNERNTDLAVSTTENLLSGARHTDAVEVEAIGRITPDWEVFTAAAYMEANVDEATGSQANTLDKEPVNTPHYTFNLWNSYNFGAGWRAGIGIDGAGDRYANGTNATLVPAYSRWDSMVEYEQKSYSLKLSFLNMFDREYYESVYTGHVVPGAARTLQLKAEYKF
jgi:catecholate siderophore receptor